MVGEVSWGRKAVEVGREVERGEKGRRGAKVGGKVEGEVGTGIEAKVGGEVGREEEFLG